MSSSLLSDFDVQITCLQEALSLTYGLKEQVMKLQNEKKEVLEKCDHLLAQIESIKNRECSNCTFLLNQLNNERKEKASVKKDQKAKLLKVMAQMLESIDDVNTNHMTNAHQLLTQLVCNGLDDSTESRKEQKTIQLLNDREASEDESHCNILANETIEIECEELSNDCDGELSPLLVVPETEPTTSVLIKPRKIQLFPNEYHTSRNKNGASMKENRAHFEEQDERQPTKRLKSSPHSSVTDVNLKEKQKMNSPVRPLHVDTDEILIRNPDRSPSVLSEMIELATGSAISQSCKGTTSVKEEKETCWKMKPSSILESNIGNATKKKLKQMTLSLARPEKKHDITLSQTFKGGVANVQNNQKDEEKDVVLPSPEHLIRRGFIRKQESHETFEDPDMTLFQPGITSTCLPVNNSFDRLPEVAKSPPYKYRRDVVRKREERQKLPGQDCDQCAKYYAAAGIKPDDVRARLNACSRHRDKYQIRANTPPGFWDPVFPSTPPEDGVQKKS